MKQRLRLTALLASELAMVWMEIHAIRLCWEDMGKRMFRFYTQDSNILALIVCAVCAVCTLAAMIRGKERRPHWAMALKHMAASGLMITFLVAAFVLTPIESTGTWASFCREFRSMMLSGELLYLHTVCPLVLFVSFLLLEDDRRLPVRCTLLTLIPTLLYGFVTLYMNITRAYAGPYFFFQVYRQPVHMTVIWCIGVLLSAFAISAVLVGLSRIGRERGDARGAAPRPRQRTRGSLESPVCLRRGDGGDGGTAETGERRALPAPARETEFLWTLPSASGGETEEKGERNETFLYKTKTLTALIRGGQGRRFVVCTARKGSQDSSVYQRRAESGRAERGSDCFRLSRRGSDCFRLSRRGSCWMKTQFSKKTG